MTSPQGWFQLDVGRHEQLGQVASEMEMPCLLGSESFWCEGGDARVQTWIGYLLRRGLPALLLIRFKAPAL